MNKALFRLLVLLVCLASAACATRKPPAAPAVPAVSGLIEHQKIFEKRVDRLGDRVFVAVGYALATSIMVVVDGGKVIIDATESLQAASEIKAEFDRIAPGPVLAVIYTHSHPDHVLGASVFAEPGVPIWAHEKVIGGLNEQFASLGATLRYRGSKQYGEHIDPALRYSNGIGPILNLDPGPVPPILYPTQTFTKAATFEIGGVTFVLREAFGETDDQIFVWLPEERVLCPADNVYQAFPNLYATRGVPPRPVRNWIAALDEMRALRPAYLAPGHTGPVIGEAKIQEILTAYRDAIAFVHDSVIRMANEGKSPDDMVRDIELPPHLRDHPYLQEYYGKVSWSVRGIYDGYLGWFDGNATNLSTLHPQERSRRLIPLLGGRDKILAEVQMAVDREDMQWAAELADLLLAENPKDDQAKSLKAKALMWLGRADINPNARCYLMSTALELEGRYPAQIKPNINTDTLADVPIEVILRSFPERLDPEKTAEVEMTVGFFFTDSNKEYSFIIRRGVGEFRPAPAENPDLSFTATERDFKAMLIGDLPAAQALTTGRIQAEGGLARLLKFQSYLIKL